MRLRRRQTDVCSCVRPRTALRGPSGDGHGQARRPQPALRERLLRAAPLPRDPAWFSRPGTAPHSLLSLLGRHARPTAAQGDPVLPGGCGVRGGPGRCAARGGPDGGPSWSCPQAVRTPSRSEAGLQLLAAYYKQLCLLDARFVTPARSLGLLFHW